MGMILNGRKYQQCSTFWTKGKFGINNTYEKYTFEIILFLEIVNLTLSLDCEDGYLNGLGLKQPGKKTESIPAPHCLTLVVLKEFFQSLVYGEALVVKGCFSFDDIRIKIEVIMPSNRRPPYSLQLFRSTIHLSRSVRKDLRAFLPMLSLQRLPQNRVILTF